MPATPIDGKALASARQDVLRHRIQELRAAGVEPCLAAVSVGSDPGWQVYQKRQAASCEQVGIRYHREDLPDGISQAALTAAIERLNADSTIHGILIQSPLPAPLDVRPAQAQISPAKDVEGVNPANLGLVLAGRHTVAPCTALSAFALAQHALPDLTGVEACVVGASVIVGKPVAQLLIGAGATPTICHIDTRDVAHHTRHADLVVVAVGRPGFLTGEMVKPGACVIDVGINRVTGVDGKGRTVGDVAEDVWEVAGAVTPVPGGVGAMTTTILLEATAAAAEALHAEDQAEGTDLTDLLREAGLQLNPEQSAGVARLLSRHIVHQPGAFGFRSAFSRRLAEGVILLDGAVSTELMAAGLEGEQLHRAQLDHTDELSAVHRAYLEAGAQVITANTFAANRYRQSGNGLQATLLAQAGVRVARGIAEQRAWVYGSIGPTGQMVGAEISEAAAEDAFAEVALAMADAGADGFIIETMPANREAACALRGVRRVSRLPVIACRNFTTIDDADIAAFAALCREQRASAIGVNCITGLRTARALVARLRSASDLPVAVRPNGGFPQRRGDRLSYHLHPVYYADQMLAAVAAGAALVGGCCGVGPRHIAALAPRLPGVQPGAAEPLSPEPDRRPPPAADRKDNGLLSAIRGDELPIIALHAVNAHAQVDALSGELEDAGIDAFGYLAAWPGADPSGRLAARTRRLMDRHGRAGVIELVAGAGTLRDAQEQLLEAHLMGIETVIIDSGLLAIAGEHGADTADLLRLVRELNDGRRADGANLPEATSFAVGLRLCEGGEQHVQSWMAIGVDFLSVQPIYSPRRFRSVMAACPADVPVLAEVLVLADADTAREVANEMPDMAVPDRLVERLEQNPDEDVRGVLRFLQAWRQRLDGVILLIPEGGGAAAVAVANGLGAATGRS